MTKRDDRAIRSGRLVVGLRGRVTALAIVLLASCVSLRQYEVASAGHVGCRPDDIQISDRESTGATETWMARCGGHSWQCSVVYPSDTTCTPVNPESLATVRPEAPVRRARFDFAREGDALRGVRMTFTTARIELVFTYAPERGADAVSLEIPSATPDEAGLCRTFRMAGNDHGLEVPLRDGQASLSRSALIAYLNGGGPHVATFCSRTWRIDANVIEDFEQFEAYARRADEDREAVAAHLAEAPSSAPEPDADVATPEEQLRARLNEVAAAISACVGSSEPCAIEVSWDATGDVSLHVRGSHDDAVRACVIAAVGPFEAPSGSPGRLIHAITPR